MGDAANWVLAAFIIVFGRYHRDRIHMAASPDPHHAY